MKITIELNENETLVAEGWNTEAVLEDVLKQAGLIEEGDSVRFVSQSESWRLDKG
ncbi:hypothetical protein N9955_00355 [bacterium]|nr:hypothetical protein [bacterium]